MSITLLPFDPQVNLGGRQVGLVRLELSSGDFVDEAVRCVGVSVNRACVESVTIQLGGIGVDRDVPCAGEPPTGCATPPPTPEPAAVAASKPFSLASLDIAIDRKGRYEVELGTASLPDGYLSDRSFSLANPAPEDFWIDDGVLLQVRPDLSGRPPVGSVYRDPYDGPEPVTIFLVFTVTDLDAPSVLQVRDVIVR
jgi:hypothetical protein